MMVSLVIVFKRKVTIELCADEFGMCLKCTCIRAACRGPAITMFLLSLRIIYL